MLSLVIYVFFWAMILKKVRVGLKSIIIKFWREFCFWYGKSVVSNKLSGFRKATIMVQA